MNNFQSQDEEGLTGHDDGTETIANNIYDHQYINNKLIITTIKVVYCQL